MQKFFKTMKWVIGCSLALVMFLGMALFQKNEQGMMPNNGVMSGITSGATEDLFAGYAWRVFGKNNKNNAPQTFEASSKLGDKAKNLYDFLDAKIELVASGDLESTVFNLDTSILSSLDAKMAWSKEELGVSVINDDIAKLAGQKFMEQFELDDVVTALMVDDPYSLYWFDKVDGFTHKYSMLPSSDYVNIVSLTISFRVSMGTRTLIMIEATLQLA